MNKAIYMLYIFILILCSLVRINLIQNILIILSSFILLIILNIKFKIKDSKFKLVSSVIVIINIALIYFNYYTSIRLRFSDGLVYGVVGDSKYLDTWNYYYESKHLADLWMNGQFVDWIKGNVLKGEAFYGYYNFFVIWNAALRILFGDNLILLIIIKYQFSIGGIYLLYKISNEFLTSKYSRLAVVLMNFFPGFLLVNISLMRDNLVYLFILYVSYLVIINKNMDKKNWLIWFKILISIAIITYMRVYIGIMLAISLLIYYIMGKLNLKRLIAVSFILILSILVVGGVTYKLGYGFLGKDLILNADSLERWNPEKISSPIKFIFWSIYYIFFGGKLIGSFHTYIGNVLNLMTPIFISIFILPTFLVIFTKKNDKKTNHFILFSFIFSILSGGIVFFIFTGIVPRLYICWIWANIIIFCCLLKNIMEMSSRVRSLLLVQYIFYVVIILLYIVN
ncbi:hypothetical protein B2H94_11775 [Clostridium sporogenes]|uniref:Glycosyltransferase RgtA/B/C/D-like domain-containing protein n=1 Tax=Clostridium sporogenes TaxID=1509 RepID=A0ABD6RML8_CLOSG|nr:hypothetical protein [Clostridium sporogenes]OSB16861.1 hypothetical protein B2H94_11775 [Clostridium sporogenes]